MSALREFWERTLALEMLQWLCASAGRHGSPSVTASDLCAHDDYGHARLSDREREIELRILMSNWM
jgi:hypothetical protein